MVNPGSSLAVVAAIAAVNTGTEQEEQMTRLGSLRFAQLEQAGYEMGRTARAFVGGITLVAGGIAPVVDYPTTTGPIVLYNSNPGGGKNYHIKRVSGAYASGTEGAAGFGLFGGVTPLPLATPLVANGATNFRTQATRGYGVCSGYIDVAKTIAAGTAWMHLGGIVTLAATVTGAGYTVDVSGLGLIVPPTYAFTWGVLGDTGSTAKFVLSVAWDEIDGDLP